MKKQVLLTFLISCASTISAQSCTSPQLSWDTQEINANSQAYIYEGTCNNPAHRMSITKFNIGSDNGDLFKIYAFLSTSNTGTFFVNYSSETKIDAFCPSGGYLDDYNSIAVRISNPKVFEKLDIFFDIDVSCTAPPTSEPTTNPTLRPTTRSPTQKPTKNPTQSPTSRIFPIKVEGYTDANCAGTPALTQTFFGGCESYSSSGTTYYGRAGCTDRPFFDICYDSACSNCDAVSVLDSGDCGGGFGLFYSMKGTCEETGEETDDYSSARASYTYTLSTFWCLVFGIYSRY